MSPFCPGNDPDWSKRLFVYECLGTGLPRIEPVHPHFQGIWPEPPYYYLFFSEPAEGFVAAWITDQPGWRLNGDYALDYIQWQQVPVADQNVGPFVISLTGHTREPSTKASTRPGLRLELDPGLVFGSGLHPTSRGSLLAISHWFATEKVRTVVDFGTGTGILALACAACGARRVVVVDCNPMAVRAALRNAARNRFAGKILGVAANSLSIVQSSEDLLVMNIEWPSLMEVFREEAWGNHGAIIVSGFLHSREEEVTARFTGTGSHMLVWRHEEDGWPTLIFARSSLTSRLGAGREGDRSTLDA